MGGTQILSMLLMLPPEASPGAVMAMDAALLEEVVPEVPLLHSFLITDTLVCLHMTGQQ